jgi:ubiquinone/menaquinone biosynthesis C-methylase UbiE
MECDDLAHLQSTWEELANEDPLWAILSVPSKKGREWDIEEFFKEGRAEAAHVLDKVRSLHSIRLGTALDFGCGVGRVSQALGDHFRKVIGIDVSLRMIELARQFNKQGQKVEYWHNPQDHLGMFTDQSFDFVYSNLVLQHMKPAYAVGYINEFFRITRPEGIIIFQIPSHLTPEYVARISSQEPLPAAACRAQIRLVSGPTTLNRGERAVLQFEVTNVSAQEWVQHGRHALNLGNHWLSADRRMLVGNDGRSPLRGRLSPGQTTMIHLSITAPAKPGRYWLELDLVQEGIRWFKNAGSTSLRIPIRVAGLLTGWLVPRHTAALTPPAAFAMYGIPKEEILSLINNAGAHLLATEQHVTEWQSYKYYIAR